jgi:hypothetical protein
LLCLKIICCVKFTSGRVPVPYRMRTLTLKTKQ